MKVWWEEIKIYEEMDNFLVDIRKGEKQAFRPTEFWWCVNGRSWYNL
jgi:hypothetical protein